MRGPLVSRAHPDHNPVDGGGKIGGHPVRGRLHREVGRTGHAAQDEDPLEAQGAGEPTVRVGSIADGSTLQLGGLLLLYYNQVVGLSAQLASLALGICVFVDAFWDPLVGQFSDNLRSPLGRRHPLMYLSAPLIAVSLVLLWSPPHGLTLVRVGYPPDGELAARAELTRNRRSLL